MDKITLTRALQNKWIHNTLYFLRPVALLYLATVIGVVSQSNHTVAFKDFIPNAYAIGGGVLYFLNVALDYFQKLKAQ